MKKLLIIFNTKAGTRRANRFLPDMLELFERYGYENHVFVTLAQGDGRRIAMEYASMVDLIICIGGDGTLNETLDGLVRSGANTPLGYIAAGSTNDFASSMKLPWSIMKAAEAIMTGEKKQLDAMSFNGRYLSYVASCGAFTKTSYTTPQQIKNSLGKLAYLLEGTRDVMDIKPIHMRVETDGGDVFEDDYILSSFSNSTSIAGLLHIDQTTVDMNDGLFEVILIKSPKTMQELASILHSLTIREYNAEMISFCTAKSVKITMDPDIDWTLDGEYEKGAESIEIKNIPDAVTLIVPKDKKIRAIGRAKE